MRVLERGLNALAAELGVKFENRNWHNVITDVETAIRDIQKSGGNSSRQNWKEDLHFYSEAATNFHYFKDAWRNYTTHVHDTYSTERAKTIFDHVRGFMQHLATRLREQG